MRRVICAQMMILCVLLTACGGGEGAGASKAEELALQIRTEYIGMVSCAAQMEVTADYGERVYEYGMDLAWSQDEGTTLTLTAPADVAGVSIRIEAGETAMEFDGARIETGTLNADGLSPVDAVPALLKYVNEGFISACTEEALGETNALRVCYQEPDAQPGTGTEASVWFDLSTHAMLRGEISEDGATVVQCVFTSFQKA